MHRGWISLKDALTGADAAGVLGAAVTGEDHAVSEYETALEQELSAGFREVVARQHQAVVSARDAVKALPAAD
ncbi:PA2169 family four-helix-bundle protein [Knoellia sp. Soil729]|uniref:PA2169 family four-helix-bundle protein n=1 Tax=Knoellia sp. Soil729 TaxID=1736394 RepID=UPI001F402364